MPVTDVSHDLDARTLTIVADFPSPPKRIWEVYADPRQLERWWGPPTWPATFEQHDVVVGGRSSYYMAGPDGAKLPDKARVLATLVKGADDDACANEDHDKMTAAGGGAAGKAGAAKGKGCRAEAEAQLGRPLAKLELVADGVELM